MPKLLPDQLRSTEPRRTTDTRVSDLFVSPRDPSFFLSRLGISSARGDPEGSRRRRNVAEIREVPRGSPLIPRRVALPRRRRRRCRRRRRRRGRARDRSTPGGITAKVAGVSTRAGISCACLHLIRRDLTRRYVVGKYGRIKRDPY